MPKYSLMRELEDEIDRLLINRKKKKIENMKEMIREIENFSISLDRSLRREKRKCEKEQIIK